MSPPFCVADLSLGMFSPSSTSPQSRERSIAGSGYLPLQPRPPAYLAPGHADLIGRAPSTGTAGGRASAPSPSADSVGFTAPTFVYDRMRAMQAHAANLDLLIEEHVVDDAYRAGWKGWYDGAWRPFFDRSAGPNASSWTRLGNALTSDELAGQAEAFRQQLEAFDRSYRVQRTTDGRGVPVPASSAPGAATPPSAALSIAQAIPWYYWVGGALVLVGTGAYLYRRYAG